MFLEISIGNKELFDKEQAEYQNAVGFIESQGHIYGIQGQLPQDLDDGQRDMIQDAYNSNPEWSKRVL